MPALQQFISANPGLAVAAAFIVGAIVVLAGRILLASAGCLVRVAVVAVIVVAIVLLLRMPLVR